MTINDDASILLYDLEITPILGWAYDMYDANIIHVERPKVIMSVAYKWLGDDEVSVVALPDFRRYTSNRNDDKDVVAILHGLLDRCDIACAHNCLGFDNKVAMTRFMYHGMPPPSPFLSIDTLAVARRVFKFGANSLQFLCEQLDIGEKSSVRHHDVWRRCVDGDLEAWELMREYNINDVVLLEGLYHKLRPYMSNHPVVSAVGCPKCGSTNLQRRGIQRSRVATYGRLQCQDCGAWSRERKSVPLSAPVLV